jgi:pimeloyl-ACP methyl ester carboxylesterase
MLGEALAALYPSRLHSLIICSAPTYLPQAALDLFAFGHRSWPEACRVLGSRGWGEALRRVPGTSVGPPLGHEEDKDNNDEGYHSWWLDQVAFSPGAGLAAYATFLSTLDARPYIRRIDTTIVPVLILCPANSAAVKVEDQRRDVLDVLAKNNADNNEESEAEEGFCKMVVIDGKGHEIYVERPRECQDEVLAFLDEVASRRIKLQ